MTAADLAALPDDQLCAVVFHGMCDDGPCGDTDTSACAQCGREFEYERVGGKRRTVCPDCVLERDRDRKRRSYAKCGRDQGGKRGKQPEFVRCVGVNLNYRPGQVYDLAVVMEDVQRGLANMLDFVAG